jgi:hypothetical protein
MTSEREQQPEEDPSVAARLHRLAKHYTTTGVRRGVEAIMVVMVSPLSLPSTSYLQSATTQSAHSTCGALYEQQSDLPQCYPIQLIIQHAPRRFVVHIADR